jgi:hypothetical protein
LALVGAAIVLAALLAPTPNGAGVQSNEANRVCPAVAPARPHHKHRGLCAGEVRFHKHRKLKIRKRTGDFPAPVAEESEGDEGELPELPVGAFRQPPGAGPQFPLTVQGADGAPTGTGIKIHANRLLPASTFPAGIYQPTNTLSAQEPSVASAGRVVMYAFNWDAGYSNDGGQTFTELDPHTTFPSDVAPYFVHFGTDQVVTYDPTTQTFIWVLQEFSSGVEDVIRIAWTSPSKLIRYGSHAWRYFDLPSDACCGVGAGHWLDQPKLGFTPRYLYMNMNEGTGSTLEKTVVVRIPRAQFGTAQGPSGYGFALLDPPSLRVAQNVVGSTAFFVGHKNTSTLTVASIADNSNVFRLQDVAEPTVANQDWTMLTPGGQDLLGRQSRSQNTAVTGVTQDGAGNLWVTWSEGRAIVQNGRNVIPAGGPTQPHIAVVTLHFSSGDTISGGTKGFLWNSNYAFFLPDLATNASGEVGLTFDWGGGTSYLNHAVAFLSGGFVSVTVAGSNTDQSTTGMAGDNNLNNPAGDYQTIRPLPAPYGDCFVAAGNINHDDVIEVVAAQAAQPVQAVALPIFGGAKHVGLPVFTLFSRPGATCPIRFFPVPPVPLPPVLPPIAPEPTGETITLTCPGSVAAGQTYPISGALSPPIGAAPISVTYTSSASATPAVTHNVTTNSDGNFTDTAPGAPAGTETILASFAGDETHAAAERTCSVTVQPVFL